MARQYFREYKLTIAPKTGGVGIVVRDLRIHFNVVKTLVGIPNQCTLELFNPNSTTISKLEEKYTRILLEVGYRDNLKTIFRGEIRNVFHQHDGVDKVARIFIGDGQRAWENASFNKTFTANVPTSTVVQDIANSFKVAGAEIGELLGIPNTATNLMGQSISGSSKDLMDAYSKAYDFDWSIQNNELITHPKAELIKPDQAIVINSRTGMVGSPTLREDGVSVVTLLNSGIVPYGTIKIESVSADIQINDLHFKKVKTTNATGLYKVQEVIYDGDTHEGGWICEVRGKLI